MRILLPTIWRTSLASSAIGLSVLAPGTGLAGDAFAPAPPNALNQAHCNSLGEGFFAVGAGACVKISGYVSAGTDISAVGVSGASGSSAFAAKSALSGDAPSGMSLQPQFDTQLGPGRLYVQFGRHSE
jgi:hypothetical protein